MRGCSFAVESISRSLSPTPSEVRSPSRFCSSFGIGIALFQACAKGVDHNHICLSVEN